MKGNLTYQVHTVNATGNPQEQPLLKREFEVFVKDCTWKIRSWTVKDTNFEYYQTSFDGTNLYYTTKLADGAQVLVPRTSLTVTASSNLLQTIIVEAAPVPRILLGPGDCHIWLAFASGCYFKSLTNNTVLDFTVLNSGTGCYSETTRRQVGCRYTHSAVPPYLPSKAEYADFDYASNGRVSETTNNMVLGARFISESLTNFNGFFLPTKFIFERYFVTRRGLPY